MSEKFAQAIASIATPEDLLSALGYRAEVDGTAPADGDDAEEYPRPNTEYYRNSNVTIKAHERALFNWTKKIVWSDWVIKADGEWSHLFATGAGAKRRILCEAEAIVRAEPFPAPVDLDELDDGIMAEIEYGCETMLGGPDAWVMIEFEYDKGIKHIASGTFNEAFTAFVDPNFDSANTSIAEFVAKLTPEDRAFRLGVTATKHKRDVAQQMKVHAKKLAKLETRHKRVTGYFN